ncbi:kelch-like protein 12 [Clavelina lepadiformis]|uniref:kelch-like protein 12 n=1 Tax=Clavelina lepadiformis TaxID=159417 RepID=UPI0040429ED3
MLASLKSEFLSGPDTDEVEYDRNGQISFLKLADKHRQSGFYNDVTIRVNGRDFGANKMVLGSFSKYFHEQFTVKKPNQEVINIEDADAESVRLLIEFIYTESITVTKENVYDLLATADLLCVDEVKQFCALYLARCLCPRNVWVVRSLGDYNNHSKMLVEMADAYLRNNSEQILGNQDDVNPLMAGQMKIGIQARNKKVISEESMFKKLILWVKYNQEDRRKKFPNLFRLLNLGSMSHYSLEEVVANEELVRENTACYELYVATLRDNFNKARRRRESEISQATNFLVLGGKSPTNDVIQLDTNKFEWRTFPKTTNTRLGSSAATVQDRVYIVGGLSQDLATCRATDKVEFWDFGQTGQQRWVKTSPMKKKRYVTGAVALNGNLLVVGGADEMGYFLASSETYDPIRDEWNLWRNMNKMISAHAVAVCRGSVYVIGGHDTRKVLSNGERCDARSGEWEEIAPMRNARRWPAAAVLGDTIYAIGGDETGDKKSPLDTVEAYDVRANAWRSVDCLTNQRRGCGACAVGGKIYCVGGADASVTHTTVECYDPVGDEWSALLKEADSELLYPAVAVMPVT